MPLRLKTKFTLATALLVLAVAAVISSFFVARLTEQVIAQTNGTAARLAQQIFQQAQRALNDAATEGKTSASEKPQDVLAYVKQTLDDDAGFTSMVDSVASYPSIYEVTVADQHGTALISSDPGLPGRTAIKRAPLDDLVQANFVAQLRVLYGPPRVYEVGLPFRVGSQQFGEIRVALQTALLRNEIAPGLKATGQWALGAVLLSTLLAALVSHITLAPLAKISEQLDRITKGEFEAAPVQGGDELSQVSTKINVLGQQLRGVQEIFSTLRENINQVMSGLDDGLLLFGGDGRAVLVSPSVEKFLGAAPEALLGKPVGEVFPSGHPLREALHIEGDRLDTVEPVEVHMNGVGPRTPSRVAAGVQVIAEGSGATRRRMGALVTLRDLDSLDHIGTHLETSERLSALGRVTAGVAHEVKNPLNSMRLWLENLKQTLPPAAGNGGAQQETAQQAVQILDSEIDRLDRVVKTFLDFTRPVELQLAETDLGKLIQEVAAIARPQMEQAGVELKMDWGPAPQVHADRQLLKQAILNLTLNAVEAMQGAQNKRLTLALGQNAEWVEIRVADTGPGIPPEHRARIFQLFFTTRKGGSGIGLATAFRIVQLHGGSIDFETEIGHGTTFCIQLPPAHP